MVTAARSRPEPAARRRRSWGLTCDLVVTKLCGMTAKGANTTTRRTADERRDEIVAAALHAFAAGGYAGTSTDSIAKAVGVSQPYLFQLFGTKRGLFLAVVRHCFGRVRLAFEEAVRRGPSDGIPCSNLDLMAGAYMEMLADRDMLRGQLQAYAACGERENPRCRPGRIRRGPCDGPAPQRRIRRGPSSLLRGGHAPERRRDPRARGDPETLVSRDAASTEPGTIHRGSDRGRRRLNSERSSPFFCPQYLVTDK